MYFNILHSLTIVKIPHIRYNLQARPATNKSHSNLLCTMNSRQQMYTMSAIVLLAFGIATLPIFSDVYANPQKMQEIEMHVNESLTALDNDDVEGARTHIQIVQDLISTSAMKDGNKTSMMQDHNMSSMTTG